MNYQMRIQCVKDELKTTVAKSTQQRVEKLLRRIKEGCETIRKHDKRMNEIGVRTHAPTSVMVNEGWPPSHLILVIERERMIKRLRTLRNKIIQILGGHDYYIASVSLYGNGLDYSIIK